MAVLYRDYKMAERTETRPELTKGRHLYHLCPHGQLLDPPSLLTMCSQRIVT